MKIRTPSAAQSAQLEALGATPIDMPAPAIYNNLDRGVIDATMIPMSAALDFKLIEVATLLHDRRAARPLAVPGGDERGALRASLPAESPEDHRRHHRPVAQPQGRADLRQEERRGDRGGQEARKFELIPLSAEERQRWIDAFKPMIAKQVAEAEKKGLPAKGLVGAYGLLG